MENTNASAEAKGGKIKIVIISLVVIVGLIIVAAVVSSLTGQLRSGNSFQSAVPSASVMRDSVSVQEPAELNSKMEAAGLAADAQALPDVQKKVIKNGNLTVKVGRIDDAAKEITQIAKDNGGDIFSSNFYENADKKKSGTITLKVPNSNFEKAFEEIKKTASLVVRESIGNQDVTEQYIDLESRLKNMRAEEQSYLQILNRASTVDEILKVTRQLSQVRGEIEAMESQKKYLDSQIDMSLITVYLAEDSQITISDSWRPLRTVKETVNSLLSDVKGFINFLIVLIIRIIPILVLYLLVVLIIFLIGRKIYRRIKNRKTVS